MNFDYLSMMSDPLISLQTELVTRESIPLPYAGVLANEALNHFDGAVKEGVLLWLENRLPEDFTVNGSSVKSIREMTGVSEFAALCILNMRISDPDSVSRLTWFEFRDTMITE